MARKDLAGILIEEKILPFSRKNDIAMIVYSPMERGLLTGAVTMDRKFAPGDHRATHKFFRPENRKKVLTSLEKIKPIAQSHNVSLAQLIINWTIHEPGITAALVGARNADQAKHNAAAMTFTLTESDRTQIREAFDQTSHDLMTAK